MSKLIVDKRVVLAYALLEINDKNLSNIYNVNLVKNSIKYNKPVIYDEYLKILQVLERENLILIKSKNNIRNINRTYTLCEILDDTNLIFKDIDIKSNMMRIKCSHDYSKLILSDIKDKLAMITIYYDYLV